MAEEKSAKGKGRKIGRNKNKCAQYKAFHTRDKNQLKKVLRSSGYAEAERYAKAHNLFSYLGSLSK